MSDIALLLALAISTILGCEGVTDPCNEVTLNMTIVESPFVEVTPVEGCMGVTVLDRDGNVVRHLDAVETCCI
jgi:hypothetical protein